MTRKRGSALSTEMVAFTAKELFFEINRKIDLLTESTNKKADKLELDALEVLLRTAEKETAPVRELRAVTDRVTALEKNAASESAVADSNRRIEDNARTSRLQWIGLLVVGVLGATTLILQLTHVIK